MNELKIGITDGIISHASHVLRVKSIKEYKECISKKWVSVESLARPLDKALLLLGDLWRLPNRNQEIDDKNIEVMKVLMDLKEDLGLTEFKEEDAKRIKKALQDTNKVKETKNEIS